jgi:hypothetical protein
MRPEDDAKISAFRFRAGENEARGGRLRWLIDGKAWLGSNSILTKRRIHFFCMP